MNIHFLNTYFAHNNSIRWGSRADESYKRACKICIALVLRSAGSITRLLGALLLLLFPLLAALLPKLIRLSSSPEATSKDSGGQLWVGSGSSCTKLCWSAELELFNSRCSVWTLWTALRIISRSDTAREFTAFAIILIQSRPEFAVGAGATFAGWSVTVWGKTAERVWELFACFKPNNSWTTRTSTNY